MTRRYAFIYVFLISILSVLVACKKDKVESKVTAETVSPFYVKMPKLTSAYKAEKKAVRKAAQKK